MKASEGFIYRSGNDYGEVVEVTDEGISVKWNFIEDVKTYHVPPEKFHEIMTDGMIIPWALDETSLAKQILLQYEERF
jgi:CTP-dependent riboflavin kinase